MKRKIKSFFKKIGLVFTGIDKFSYEQKKALAYINSLNKNDFMAPPDKQLYGFIKGGWIYFFNYLPPISRFFANLSTYCISLSIFALLFVATLNLAPMLLSFLLPVFFMPLLAFSSVLFVCNLTTPKINKQESFNNLDLENIHPKLLKAIKCVNVLPVYYFESELNTLLSKNPEIKKDTYQSSQAKKIKSLEAELVKLKKTNIDVKTPSPIYKDII